MSWGAQNRSKDEKTPSTARALSRKPKLALCGIQPYFNRLVLRSVSFSGIQTDDGVKGKSLGVTSEDYAGPPQNIKALLRSGAT